MGSVLHPPGEPGAWGCVICHPPSHALSHTEVERFVESAHGPEFDALEQAWRGDDTSSIVVRKPPSVQTALDMLARWREEDNGWTKARVVAVATHYGEVHASMPELALLAQRDVNATAVIGALKSSDLLEKLNRSGEIEKRGQAFVWRLSAKGRVLGIQLRELTGGRLPGPRRSDQEETL